MRSISNSSHKGQVWTIDFTTGLLVLFIILIIYMVIWNGIAARWNSYGARTQMESSADFASESLLATAGEPKSWEMLPHIDGNVTAIGLVNGRNELNQLKIEKLVSENATAYSTIKARLGMQRYEFGLEVTDLGANIVYYRFGRFSSGSLNNTLEFDRFAILNNTPVIVHMEVWGR